MRDVRSLETFRSGMEAVSRFFARVLRVDILCVIYYGSLGRLSAEMSEEVMKIMMGTLGAVLRGVREVYLHSMTARFLAGFESEFRGKIMGSREVDGETIGDGLEADD